MRRIGIGCGGLLTLSCLFFVAAAIGDLAVGDFETAGPGVLAGMVVFFGGIAAGAGAFSYYNVRRLRAEQQSRRRKQILQVAARLGGRVTAIEIASETGMDLLLAEAVLDDYCRMGAAHLNTTESGEVVYVFGGMLSPEERASAEDLLLNP